MTDKMCRSHCSETSATFSPREEETNLNNFMDKNRICSCENVRNLVIIISSLLVRVN